MAGKIDPAGNYTGLGLYDSLKDCKVYAGLDFVSEMRHKHPKSLQWFDTPEDLNEAFSSATYSQHFVHRRPLHCATY